MEGWKDDGVICEAIDTPPLQGFAMAQTLAKLNRERLRDQTMNGRGRLSGPTSLVVNTVHFRVEGTGFEPRGGSCLRRISGILFVLMSTREQ